MVYYNIKCTLGLRPGNACEVCPHVTESTLVLKDPYHITMTATASGNKSAMVLLFKEIESPKTITHR